MSFRFRHFQIDDSRCGMKVGTDGVLLGAWAFGGSGSDRECPAPPSPCILDIGTGSGLVALMLAQRFTKAHLTGIDIDKTACIQAAANAEASPFAERVQTVCSAIQDFLADETGKFDFIASNPPYYDNSLVNPDPQKAAARHTDTLSFADLFRHSARLLRNGGRLALILPADCFRAATVQAEAAGLRLCRLCHVHTTSAKPAKRIMAEWQKESHTTTNSNKSDIPPTEHLVLQDGSARSMEYSRLTKDFYL